LERFNLSDSELRPYFSLENVKQGIFDLTNKLWNLSYKENTELPLYHEDAMVYEVSDESGLIGLLYMDFHPRDSKGAGAWMTSYRKQYKVDGENVMPVISIVCNFSKPTADKPALLSFDETETFFHEFGHALHGLLSDNTYSSLSGTSVPRDFVELPSQIMENWASEAEFLKMYAKHYKTNEPIPDELIKKMQESSKFNSGFATTEFLAAAFLDMDWHTITEKFEGDVNKFETENLNKLGLIDEIVVRYRSTYFAHIFAGGYSSGYYSYTWAEVIEADAFQAFKENGIFDKETAKSFRENILSKGGTIDADKMYRNFRGRDPKIDALLKRKGFSKN
jgi:peptidyl-dipeptidase Dcp